MGNNPKNAIVDILMRACVFRILLIAGVVGACATSEDVPTSLVLKPIGTHVTGEFSIADKNVPLPDGAWTLIGTKIEKNSSRGYHTVNMLAKINDKKLLAAAEIFTNLPIKKPAGAGILAGNNSDRGWLTVRSCVRDDMHFRKVFSNTRLGNQDCWWVNHRRMDGPPDTEHWKEARKFLAENRIRAPLDMISVSYRLANEFDYLTVHYFFDPETSGFKSTQDIHWKVKSWATSDWHPDQVKDDEEKQRFIAKLISWGEAWHKKIKTSLEMN